MEFAMVRHSHLQTPQQNIKCVTLTALTAPRLLALSQN